MSLSLVAESSSLWSTGVVQIWPGMLHPQAFRIPPSSFSVHFSTRIFIASVKWVTTVPPFRADVCTSCSRSPSVVFFTLRPRYSPPHPLWRQDRVWAPLLFFPFYSVTTRQCPPLPENDNLPRPFVFFTSVLICSLPPATGSTYSTSLIVRGTHPFFCVSTTSCQWWLSATLSSRYTPPDSFFPHVSLPMPPYGLFCPTKPNRALYFLLPPPSFSRSLLGAISRSFFWDVLLVRLADL